MPDIDEILRQGARREAKQSIWLGLLVAAAGLGMIVASKRMFGDQTILFSGGAFVIGLGLIGRGVMGSRGEIRARKDIP